MSGPAGVDAAKIGVPMDPIVEAIAAQRRRNSLRFRLTFFLTWGILVALIIGSLWAANAFDVGFIRRWGAYILGGVPTTLIVAAVSITVAIVFAIFGALGRLSSRASIYGIASFYVSLVRGTPLIVQILFIYLALPRLWPGFAGVPAIVLGTFALAFNYGAYMTEIFRAGIQAIPRGQIEAAGAIGMTQSMTMRRVIMPQAIRIVTPAIGNDFIAMIKDSALVSYIGVQELLWRAQRAGNPTFRTLEALLLAAAVYWFLTIIFSFFQDRLEKRMAESDRRV